MATTNMPAGGSPDKSAEHTTVQDKPRTMAAIEADLVKNHRRWTDRNIEECIDRRCELIGEAAALPIRSDADAVGALMIAMRMGDQDLDDHDVWINTGPPEDAPRGNLVQAVQRYLAAAVAAEHLGATFKHLGPQNGARGDDPLIAMWQERQQAKAVADAGEYGPDEDELNDRLSRIEGRIARATPVSPEGAAIIATVLAGWFEEEARDSATADLVGGATMAYILDATPTDVLRRAGLEVAA